MKLEIYFCRKHATQSKDVNPHESFDTRRIEGGIKLYIKLQKHRLDQIAARNSFPEVKLRRLRRKTHESKYDTRDKNPTDHRRDRRHNIEYK